MLYLLILLCTLSIFLSVVFQRWNYAILSLIAGIVIVLFYLLLKILLKKSDEDLYESQKESQNLDSLKKTTPVENKILKDQDTVVKIEKDTVFHSTTAKPLNVPVMFFWVEITVVGVLTVLILLK